MTDVVVYSKPFCPFCMRAKSLLKKKGATFTEISIAGDQDKRAAMIERADGRTTVPQIFVGGEHVGGSDDLAALEKSGELDRLLADR